MNIGKMIKQERERQGLSMNKLAKTANIGQSTFSYIEAGYRQPTFDVLERIIIALGFSRGHFRQNQNFGFRADYNSIRFFPVRLFCL